MFVRLIRERERKEILVNVNNIWKIEVQYGEPGNGKESENVFITSLKKGMENPEAVRIYKVFFGGEDVLVIGNPNDPVVQVFEKIYKDATKG